MDKIITKLIPLPTLVNDPPDYEPYIPPPPIVDGKFQFIPLNNNLPTIVPEPQYQGGVYEPEKNVIVEPITKLITNNVVAPDVELLDFVQPATEGIVGISPNITYAGPHPLFLLDGATGLGADWSLYKAQQQVDYNSYGITGLGNVYMNGGITGVGDISMNNANITGCSSIKIDNQILTADPTDLLLNGVPIATINNLPNIEEWAEYDALADLQLNGAGISGAPFGVTGSKYYGFNTGSTLTATANTLFFNGSAIGGTGYTGVSLWSTYPMVHNLSANNYSITGVSGISGNSATFNTISGTTGNFTNVNTTNINGTPYVPTSNWAQTPANHQVQLAGNSIASGGGNNVELDADQKIIMNTTVSDIDLTTGYSIAGERANINETAGIVNLTADKGNFVLSPSAINLTASNGQYGNITLTANGSSTTGSNGVVNIIANAGVVAETGLGSGGAVNIVANTDKLLKSLTSACRMFAESVELYAGVFTPKASLIGELYLYGQAGAQLVSSVLPPAFAPSPLTVYLYGDQGVVSGSDMYVYRSIRPYWNGITNPTALTVMGRTILGVDYPVYLEIVGGIIFSNQTVAQILGCKTFTGNNTAMTGINSIQVADVNVTGSAALNSVTTNTIVSATSNSLTLSGVSAISGNAIGINSGSGTITLQGAETDLLSTNTFITKAQITTLDATTINNVSGSNVVMPCKSLNATFGAVALTIAPIVVYQSGDLTWNWNNISKLGTSTSITVGVDTVGTYAFAMRFLVGSTSYNLNTYTLDSPFVANSGAYNGVSVVSATLNDSFNNTIANGSTYKIIVYMWCGSVSTANTTGAKLNFNFVSSQSL